MKTFVNILVVLTGGAVLAIEFLGTRLLGPYYGVSIYLWSALVSVTLLALSGGYYLGGCVADRRPNLTTMAGICLVAGVWTSLLPLLSHPLLQLFDPAGLRVSLLATSFILFFPPLALLGMVTPYAVKLRAASLETVGKTTGGLYALSTLGSVCSALLTGFVLIPNFGVSGLFAIWGAILIATGATGLTLQKRWVSAIAFLIMAGVSAGPLRASVQEHVDNAHGVIAVTESPYAELSVIDTNDARHLLVDGALHSIIDTVTGNSKFAYVSLFDMPAHFFDNPGSMLCIGLGAGSAVRNYYRQGWKVDAVELDPGIPKLAESFFQLRPDSFHLVCEDGRSFLQQSTNEYQVILLDAYGSSSIPFHLVTREAFEAARARLSPDGILAVNIEAVGWDDIIVKKLCATLHTVFDHVTALPIAEPPDQLGNLVLLASQTSFEMKHQLVRDYLNPDYRFSGHYWLVHGWDNQFDPGPGSFADVLTDEHNPIDILSEHVNYAVRKHLKEYFKNPTGMH